MTPLISNTGETRFLFGVFEGADSAAVFHGAAVHGVDFTYDPETNLPISGTVHRIDVQTRNAVEVLATHASHSDINTSVVDLNTAFFGADAPWFDATDLLPARPQEDETPLDLRVNLDSAQMAELASGKTGLQLKTGEFLSAHELSGIFAATKGKVTPKKRARVRRKTRCKDPLAMVNAIYENAANSNFSDLDIEALENDLKVGTL